MSLPEDSRVFGFSSEGEQIYNLQITVLQTGLLGAPDELSNYTCHSIPHVREVMQQAEYLFDVLHDWITDEIGLSVSELPEARVHLLLAAKLHDVGMCGTERLRKLLVHTDNMYHCFLGSSCVDADRRRKDCTALERFAREADEELLGWDRADKLMNGLCSRILCADPQRTNMSELTAQYHETVKNAIRRHHGENSARWTAVNRDVLESRYGADIDWNEVAVLVAMHNGGFKHHVDAEGNQKQWLDYCGALCSRTGLDATFLLDRHTQRRVLALASILRLADQRRSGSGLLTLDQRPIQVVVKADGGLQAEYEYAGVTRRLGLSKSNQIILSEKLNEFGEVALNRREDQWMMTHTLHFAMPGNKAARMLLIGKRIPGYMKEIQESLFRVCYGFGHVLCIRLEHKGEEQPFDERMQIPTEKLVRLDMKDDNKEESKEIFDRIDQAFQRFSTVWIEAVP